MYRRAHVMQKSGERKSLGSATAANFLITFQNDCGKSVLCDSDRCSQSIWPGTYDYRVMFVCCSHRSAFIFEAGTAWQCLLVVSQSRNSLPRPYVCPDILTNLVHA